MSTITPEVIKQRSDERVAREAPVREAFATFSQNFSDALQRFLAEAEKMGADGTRSGTLKNGRELHFTLEQHHWILVPVDKCWPQDRDHDDLPAIRMFFFASTAAEAKALFSIDVVMGPKDEGPRWEARELIDRTFIHGRGPVDETAASLALNEFIRFAMSFRSFWSPHLTLGAIRDSGNDMRVGFAIGT